MPYDTPPGRRIAYDDDGTAVFGYKDGEPLVEQSGANIVELNDEDNSGVDLTGALDGNNRLVFIFPELREFDGIYIQRIGNGGGTVAVHRSVDTTNGYDGTWVQVIAALNVDGYGPTYTTYRNEIQSVAENAIRGVRLSGFNYNPAGVSDWRYTGVHLYGSISPGETPDRLLFIDELTGLEFTIPKDFGDVPRGSAREFEWRLKNNSTVAGNNLTINTIQFTAESLFLASGGWYTHSVGGDSFQGTKNITSLAPEASSSLIVTRQVIPQNEVVGPHSARIQATHTSLS